MIHNLLTSSIYFYLDIRVEHTTICIATHMSHASMCIATCVYIEHIGFLKEMSVSYMTFLYQYLRVP